MDFSRWFKRHEFACKCGCGFDVVDVELLRVLEIIRAYFSSPVVINSGCRCERHNRRIGGSENSQHVFGKAADIVVKDVSPDEVYKLLDQFKDCYGLGKYSGWTHIDVREGMARW